MENLTILGVDPGSRKTGYGVVKTCGNRISFIASGVIKASTNESTFLHERLANIYSGLTEVIEAYKPSVAVVEDMFFARNAQSALKLGHARGAAILAATHGGLELFEYTPLEIKKAVAGYGKADKGQIQYMVKILLKLEKEPAQDASDALAAAICHANTSKMRITIH